MTEQIQLVIDPEFSSICWKLTDEERAHLAESLLAEGCREPILYWDVEGKPIIDGHNRYELCLENGVPYKVRPMRFDSRQEVIAWIARNQLGRRNCSEAQKSLLRGQLAMEGDYTQSADNSPGGPKRPGPRTNRAAVNARVAAETGVSEATVRNDVKFATAMDTLGSKSPTLRRAALSGRIDRRDAIALADVPVEVLRDIEGQPEGEWKSHAKAAARDAWDQRPAPEPGRRAEQNAAKYLRGIMGVVAVTDVHASNMGYDLEVVLGNNKKIFVEVKGVKAFSEPFSLTTNEHSTAQHHGDDYLVALVIDRDPFQVQVIRNPVASLHMQKKCEKWSWHCENYGSELRAVGGAVDLTE